MRVTGISGSDFTILRAQEGTIASAHNTPGKSYGIVAGITARLFTAAAPQARILGADVVALGGGDAVKADDLAFPMLKGESYIVRFVGGIIATGSGYSLSGSFDPPAIIGAPAVLAPDTLRAFMRLWEARPNPSSAGGTLVYSVVTEALIPDAEFAEWSDATERQMFDTYVTLRAVDSGVFTPLLISNAGIGEGDVTLLSGSFVEVKQV